MAAYMRGLFVVMIAATLVAQEPRPGPGKTKSDGSQSDEQQNDSSKQKSPSKTQTLSNPVPAATTNPHSIEPIAKDKQQTTVDIRAIPHLIVEPVKDWTDWGMWIFSLLLAIVGILQVVILSRQTKIINESLALTRQQVKESVKSADAAKSAADVAVESLKFSIGSFRQQVRPYVIVESIRLNRHPLANAIIGVEAVLRNTGSTPALKFRQSHAVDLKPHTCGIALAAFSSDSGVANIGASLVRAIRVFGGRDISKDERDAILSGVLTVCYSAMIEYEDIFGEVHQTVACAFYRPPKLGTAVGDGDLTLYACSNPEHNSVK